MEFEVESEGKVQQADFLLKEAYSAQMEENFDTAINLYKKSIAAFPTAEAHTFLGWTYSHQNKLDEAIGECRRAIAVDPGFGNPYNDIGSYLMKQGKPQEAIGWLEKAKKAPRYEARHFPYLNLGRIYLATGKFQEAQREFAQAKFVFDSSVHPEMTCGDGRPYLVN
jgi:Tfp pilus assembly protein PilF